MTNINQYMKRIIGILITVCLLTTSDIFAQTDLCISSIFRDFGSQKGVTMVELSKDMLKSYNIEFYKSITFKDVTPYLPIIMQCLDEDRLNNKARKIQEIVDDGTVISAYYQLPAINNKDRKPLKRYILYKLGAKNKATLVYIEGYLDSDEMIRMLFKQ